MKNDIRCWLKALTALASVLLMAGYAQTASAQEFYQGKTISIIVGYAAGGGYDTYARTVARHLGKHIPGNPTIIVQNMTGAGSLIAANYLYKKADPDGLTMGSFGGGLVTQQALGSPGIQFDARKFEWVGSVRTGTPICAIMGFTGLKTLQDVLHSKKQLRMGSTGAGSTTDDLPRLMIGLMHAPFKVIRGYKGTSRIRVGMQRHELDGACWTWESMRTTAQAMLNASGGDQLIPFVIEGHWDAPEVKNLPQFTSEIKGEHNLEAFNAWLNAYKFFQPLSLPPQTPKARLDTLQTALQQTLDDPAFKADAKKSNLDVASVTGEEVRKLVNQTLSISKEAKNTLIKLIGRGKKQV